MIIRILDVELELGVVGIRNVVEVVVGWKSAPDQILWAPDCADRKSDGGDVMFGRVSSCGLPLTRALTLPVLLAREGIALGRGMGTGLELALVRHSDRRCALPPSSATPSSSHPSVSKFIAALTGSRPRPSQ